MSMLVLIAAQKGGVGKSTIATNLAVALSLMNFDVCIVDTDPQASSTIWNRARQDNGVSPAIQTINLSGRIGYDLIGIKNKFDVVIVDAGGRDSMEIRETAAICDLWIVPTLPNQMDAWALNSEINLCISIENANSSGKRPPACLLINRVDVLPNIQDANDLADDANTDPEMRKYLPLCPIRLCSRLDYARAPRAGKGVQEYAPEGKAAAEVIALAHYVIGEE